MKRFSTPSVWLTQDGVICSVFFPCAYWGMAKGVLLHAPRGMQFTPLVLQALGEPMADGVESVVIQQAHPLYQQAKFALAMYNQSQYLFSPDSLELVS